MDTKKNINVNVPISNKKKPQFSFSDFKKGLKSWSPVVRNKWIIKLSIVKDQIILTFFSQINGQTVIRSYENEIEAITYINFILESDHDNILY